MTKTLTRTAVAEAWKAGRAANGGTISTDGHRIYSYGHEIGYTVAGAKIAIHCTYSNTTRHHCGAVARVADSVEECPSNGKAHHQVAKAT